MTNPIKPNLKTEIIPLILILISVAFSFYFYSHFPDRVITHWNFNGEPDGWSSKEFASFFFPALIIGIYLMFLFLPIVDPKKERYDEFKRIYHIFKNYFVLFFVIIYFVSGLVNVGYNLNIGLFTSLCIGVLFVIIGNYLGKVKRNWFLGIRTPWTLSSDEVWNKTNRLGGRLFILMGIILAFVGFYPKEWSLILFFVAMVTIIIWVFVYSYLAFLKEKKKINEKKD